MKVFGKTLIKRKHHTPLLPQKYAVVELSELREMFIDVIREHIGPRKIPLGEKKYLSIDEAVTFLTEECGHKVTRKTLYALTSQLERGQEWGSLKWNTPKIPHIRVGKYLTFEPNALRKWVEEQTKILRKF